MGKKSKTPTNPDNGSTVDTTRAAKQENLEAKAKKKILKKLKKEEKKRLKELKKAHEEAENRLKHGIRPPFLELMKEKKKKKSEKKEKKKKEKGQTSKAAVDENDRVKSRQRHGTQGDSSSGSEDSTEITVSSSPYTSTRPTSSSPQDPAGDAGRRVPVVTDEGPMSSEQEEPEHVAVSRNNEPTISKSRPQTPITIATIRGDETGRTKQPHSVFNNTFKQPRDTGTSSGPSHQSIDTEPSSPNAQDSQSTKKGRFTNSERGAALSAISDFKSVHSLSDEDVFSIVFKKRKGGLNTGSVDSKVARQFWPRVREALPNRDRYTVYNFVKRLLDDRQESKWTKEDDDNLLGLVAVHGRSWEEVGTRMGRSNNAVMKRYGLLTSKGSATGQIRGWTSAQDTCLIEVISSIIKSQKQPVNEKTLREFNMWSVATDKYNAEVVDKFKKSANGVRGHWKDSLMVKAIQELNDNRDKENDEMEIDEVDGALVQSQSQTQNATSPTNTTSDITTATSSRASTPNALSDTASFESKIACLQQTIALLQLIKSYSPKDPSEVPWPTLPQHPSLHLHSNLTYSAIYNRYARVLQRVRDSADKTYMQCLDSCVAYLERKIERRRRRRERRLQAQKKYKSAEFVDTEDDDA